MKRTSINKVGKQGKINQKANKKIAELWAYHSIDYCEYDQPHDCDGMLTNAHRRKRREYLSTPDLLWNINQVARLCITSHNYLEHRREDNEEFFKRLRGE